MKINQLPYVVFQTTSRFFFKFCLTFHCHDTKALCNFLAQTLYHLVKKSQLKSKFWDFRVLGQNFPNSSTHFLKHKSVSPQILHYSLVSWHKSSAIFGLKHNRLRQKKHIKVQIFRFATDRIKTHQIAYVIFGTMSQLFFKLYITLQWPETWHFCTFSS